jgi:hypothetical protein
MEADPGPRPKGRGDEFIRILLVIAAVAIIAAFVLPAEANLFGPGSYISPKPQCPAGGNYTVGRLGERSSCSIREHNE